MNETTAPTSIMPSTPRLRTPDFSVTNSPSAAKTNGVPPASVNATSVATCSAAPSMAVSLATLSSSSADFERSRGSSGCGATDAADAKIDEHVHRQQKEQQGPLEEARDRRRQREVDLRRFTAKVQERHQEAREHNADGMEAPDEGNDDRGESISRRHRRQQLSDRPGSLTHAGDARSGAADQHAEPHTARGRDAGI